MKIALLGPCYPFRGGIAHYTASLYRALTDEGHAVKVYNFSRQYPSIFFPGKSQLDYSADGFKVPSQEILDSINPLSWLKTSRAIARFEPEMTVVTWWHPYFGLPFGLISRHVRRKTGKPVVFLCHNVLPHEPTGFDHVLSRFAFRGASGFIVQAIKELSTLRDMIGFNVPAEVAPHPVYDLFNLDGRLAERETSRREIGVSSKRVLLFFGYIRPYKGLEVLLRAMPLVKDKEIDLVIAGECYEDPERYLHLMAELGIEERVHFENRYIPNEEVARYFAAADLVTLPYLSATQSGVVQVANALGVPVLVSDVGGIPEVVEDGKTGIVVPADDPLAVARGIDRFFHEEMESSLKEGMKLKQDHFKWTNLVDTLINLNQSLLSTQQK